MHTSAYIGRKRGVEGLSSRKIGREPFNSVFLPLDRASPTWAGPRSSKEPRRSDMRFTLVLSGLPSLLALAAAVMQPAKARAGRVDLEVRADFFAAAALCAGASTFLAM